tara:strand:+ start:166 stop:1038 length:873 start_codon:yes stop_codon:yes gene_type:complete
MNRSTSSSFLAVPFAIVLAVFFVLPLMLVVVVSFWDYTEYSLIPDLIFMNYAELFYGCFDWSQRLCTTFATYLSTFKYVFLTWCFTLLIGFGVALYLAFCIRSLKMQIVLFLVCTIPFWTSNVIRMISWIPLLGRNGIVNTALMSIGVIDQPIEWLLYSGFSVTLGFVHLYTLFMVVPIFNSMAKIDKSLIEAAKDSGASAWQIITNIIIPLSRSGIMIGSIFVITIVVGDFITIGVLGGQQIASVGKIIYVEMSYLQFPAAAANAVVLVLITLLMVAAMMRVVNVRKEL